MRYLFCVWDSLHTIVFDLLKNKGLERKTPVILCSYIVFDFKTVHGTGQVVGHGIGQNLKFLFLAKPQLFVHNISFL